MKYDKTIKYGVEPFNIMNSQKAFLFHPYEEGYFSNSLSAFADIADNVSKGVIVSGRLISVNTDNGLYRSDCNNGSAEDFEYFLPVQFVHEIDNWRPFTPDEFMTRYKPGDQIRFKSINQGFSLDGIYKGFFFYGDMYVGIGTLCLSLEELFKCYEVFENGRYKPFGVNQNEPEKTA